MLQAVLFDLDGTLLDTAPDFATVLKLLCERHRRPAPTFDQVRATVSDGARALVELSFGIRENDSRFEPLRTELLALYSQHLADETRLFDGMEQVLSYIEGRGLRWGIVTNKPELYSKPLIAKLALEQRCGTLICPDHVEQRKPHPEPIHLACRQLDCLSSNAIYVGDHRRDIEAGRNAGSATIACAYGYIHADDPATGWSADHVIDTPLQLINILESL